MSILVACFLAVKGQHTGVLGFSFGVAVITIPALLSRRLVKPEWFANGLLALVWLACYFLSGSYDYRLILALPALIGCSAILTAEPGLRPPARATLALILLGAIYGWFAPLTGVQRGAASPPAT